MRKRVRRVIRGEIPPPGIVKTTGLQIITLDKGKIRVEMDIDERYL